MTKRIPVYVFRVGETVFSAAPREAVVAVYGGGGLMQTAGLSAAFGGCAVYRRGFPGMGKYHLAIWRARKASKFRQSLRKAGMDVDIIKSPPPSRLMLSRTVSR